jgi:hypothetical protein
MQREDIPRSTSDTSSSTKFINASYPFNVPVTIIFPLHISSLFSSLSPSLSLSSPSLHSTKLSKGKQTFPSTSKLHRDLLIHILPQIQNVLLLGSFPLPPSIYMAASSSFMIASSASSTTASRAATSAAMLAAWLGGHICVRFVARFWARNEALWNGPCWWGVELLWS